MIGKSFVWIMIMYIKSKMIIRPFISDLKLGSLIKWSIWKKKIKKKKSKPKKEVIAGEGIKNLRSLETRDKML